MLFYFYKMLFLIRLNHSRRKIKRATATAFADASEITPCCALPLLALAARRSHKYLSQIFPNLAASGLGGESWGQAAVALGLTHARSSLAVKHGLIAQGVARIS